MSHSTYVNSLFSQTKLYVLISIKYLIPLTCLKASENEERFAIKVSIFVKMDQKMLSRQKCAISRHVLITIMNVPKIWFITIVVHVNRLVHLSPAATHANLLVVIVPLDSFLIHSQTRKVFKIRFLIGQPISINFEIYVRQSAFLIKNVAVIFKTSFINRAIMFQ